MKLKQTVVLVLALTAVLGTTSCQNGNAGASSNNGNTLNYEVWGTDNLETVLQETTYNGTYTRSAANLNFAMAKGEAEFDQLIITAQSDISSVELIKSDLVSGENKIAKENIDVYFQKYVHCTDETKWQGVMGVKNNVNPYDVHYPDCLMNMDVAVEYKENTVKKDNNQGFTVRVTSDKDTPSGTYTGNFTLKVDGETTNVPVTLEVWDFALGNATGKTLFYPQPLNFMNGEFDNSVELYRTYYELALDYDINMEHFPGHTYLRLNTDAEGFVGEINRYWDHPNFTCYSMPNYQMTTWGQFDQSAREIYKDYMLAVAHASTPERNLFDKMVVCHDSLDEPHNSNSFDRVGMLYQAVYDIEETVIAELEAEGYFNDFTTEQAEIFKSKIRNIPQIMTATYCEGLTYNGEEYSSENINAWCPTVDLFATQADRDFYKEIAEKSEGEQWWYTCNQPQFPYPMHYTESSPVSNRIIRWMQYRYDVTGYLYWAANYFDNDTLRDPFYETQIWGDGNNPNGDGYFFYPGRAYNSDPFPTAKLLSFSDGQEDMDMLYLLEETSLEVAASYGLSEETAKKQLDDMFINMYERIADGTTYNFDYQPLVTLRQEIASLILALNEGDLISYDLVGTKATYSVYSKDVSISVNGNTVTGTAVSGGYHYTGEISLNQKSSLQVKTARTDMSLFLSNAKQTIAWNESYVKMQGGSVAIVSEGLDLKFQTKSDDITYYPMFTIGLKQFDKIKTFEDMDNLVFEFTNNSNEEFELSIGVAKGTNTIELERYVIKPNSTTRISLPLVYNNQNGSGYERVLGKADKIYIIPYSQSGAELPCQISNVTYTVKEG